MSEPSIALQTADSQDLSLNTTTNLSIANSGRDEPIVHNQSSAYNYKPIDAAAREIRLIHLLPPSKSDALVRCTIRHVSLNNTPKFDSLSYAWGDPSETKPILVDEQEFQVTENLEAALKQLQHQEHSDYDQKHILWVDAICINQADEGEKSSQVQGMFNIYRDAQRVLVWLGPASGDSPFAFKTVINIHSALASRCILPVEWPYPIKDSPQFQGLTQIGKEVEDYDELALRQLTRLFERSWWNRVWAIQEVAVCRTAVVICGPQSLGFTEFRDVALFIEWMVYAYQFSSVRVSTDILYIYHLAIGKCRERVKPAEPKNSFIRVLKDVYFSREVFASDRRDYIFALLGLHTDAQELGIIPDYSKPWTMVYREVAETLITLQGLEIISACAGIDEENESPLPSWVPDWSKPISIAFVYDYFGAPWYHASGLVQTESTAIICQQDFLKLPGVYVGKIGRIGEKLLENWDISDYASYIEELQALVEDLPKFPTKEQKEEAVWRTAVADLFTSSEGTSRCGESVSFEYKALLASIERHRNGVHEISQDSFEFRTSFDRAVQGRRSFVSDNGYIGIGPVAGRPGDEIYIFLGYPAPMVVRKGKGGMYRLVGAAYVHTIMDGELMEESPNIETIVLY